jgi:hypothetical protein
MRPLRQYSIVRVVLLVLAIGLLNGLVVAFVFTSNAPIARVLASSSAWQWFFSGWIVLSPLGAVMTLFILQRDRWLLRRELRREKNGDRAPTI